MRTCRCALAMAVAVALVGCGNEKESFAKRAGSRVGESLTDFATGVGSGVDTRLKVPVELSATMTEKGFSKTAAKSLVDISPNTKGFAVYLISKETFSGSLLAKAMDQQGQEIGRATADVTFEPDDAKYVKFTFPEEMDSALVVNYVIDAKHRSEGPATRPSFPNP